MQIEVLCDDCKRPIKINEDDLVGGEVLCPACQHDRDLEENE